MTPIIKATAKKRQPPDRLAPPSDATSLVFMPSEASRGVHAIQERQDMPNDVVTALKSLHTDAIDAGNGYEEALKDAEGHGLTSLFHDMIALHGKHADELLSLIRSLGENASDEGSFMSNVHRTIITIRSLFGGLNESILPGLIDGEKRNVSHYDDALNEQTLPESANALLLRQRDELRSAVGRMQADQP